MVSELHTHIVKIEDEMKKSYLEYSMSVIVGRALPDIRDGLKPVHSRFELLRQPRGKVRQFRWSMLRLHRRKQGEHAKLGKKGVALGCLKLGEKPVDVRFYPAGNKCRQMPIQDGRQLTILFHQALQRRQKIAYNGDKPTLQYVALTGVARVEHI